MGKQRYTFYIVKGWLMFLERLLMCGALALCSASFASPTGLAQDSLKNRLIILGDTHYDRLEDHDLVWLQTTHPDDYRQVTVTELPPRSWLMCPCPARAPAIRWT